MGLRDRLRALVRGHTPPGSTGGRGSSAGPFGAAAPTPVAEPTPLVTGWTGPIPVGTAAPGSSVVLADTFGRDGHGPPVGATTVVTGSDSGWNAGVAERLSALGHPNVTFLQGTQ